MTISSRVTATDWNIVDRCGETIAVGRAFAFVLPEAFTRHEFAWARTLFGDATDRPHIVPLTGSARISVPGATIAPLVLPRLSLAVVTSDKELYRERRDTVNLLAVDPASPRAKRSVEVLLDGAPFARLPLLLDENGAATATLRDLPAGSFRARFAGAPDDDPACEFLVAEYRLAPLVASLVDRAAGAEADTIRVRLRLETFGTPVEGVVRLELTERGARREQRTATATGGLVEAEFRLDGAGPFAVNVQLEADPSRTATVPLSGTRATERRATVFSTLGAEVSASMVPSPGARSVRGLFLEEGAERSTPFLLERVDVRRARITATTSAAPVSVAVFDPSVPQPREGAVDPDRAEHPSLEDPVYRDGEAAFGDGRYADARAAFERGRAARPNPHPFYAYYVACCRARLGALDGAVAALREAIRDGWNDFDHLSSDADLAALVGHPGYEAIRTGGVRVRSFETMAAGDTIEIDVPAPASVIAIGAVVDGRAWEGWAATIAPSTASIEIRVPDVREPSTEVTVEVDTGATDSTQTVYLVVKDARLQAGDTPTSRLAGQIKAFVEETGRTLRVGSPDPLSSVVFRPMNPPGAVYGSMPPPPSPVLSAGPDMPRPLGAAPLLAPMGAIAAPIAGLMSRFETTGALPRLPESAPPASPAIDDVPDVLFAGLVRVESGVARATVALGDAFTDYVAEAFVVGGGNWSAAEARFRAAKDPFASLDLPAFVHAEDTALGRIVAGASGGRCSVEVRRDGVELPVVVDGVPVAPGETIEGARVEAVFLATPGTYEVVVRDVVSGQEDRATGRIDEPGRLRRVTRAVQLLEPGDCVSVALDPSIADLRVLPSLDGPFAVLVEATADYGHLCCEQTAAKILAACAMYTFSNGDGSRRERAEAIILAGVRRERSMWLPGRGFKMYPESADTPNDHYGRLAAGYLRNLDLLREDDASPALLDAVEEGLQMSTDATRAYGISWPPSEPKTCAQGYAVVRFASDPAERTRAVALARNLGVGEQPVASYAPGAVGFRAENAYAAATLLRAGDLADVRRALALANSVVRALGENGRLYSTVDSVAAIALLSDLRRRGIATSGAGEIEIDGRRMSAADAVALGPGVASVAAVDGVVPVEVRRAVEENWHALASNVRIVVSLERDGRTSRRFTIGDAIDLRVRIESGYRDGDIAWICLPDALSRVVGGGQVKRFSVDFEGHDEVVVPLAATNITVDHAGGLGTQRFAVLVRNMFDEERAGNVGTIPVSVAPASSGGGAASAFGRMMSSLARLFGQN